jgi:hypothetical protein
MKQRDKRRFIRFDSLHLLDYLVLDENGNPGRYSMGRTIDVSIDGIKLETKYRIKLGSRVLITLGLEDDLIDLEGKITHNSSHAGHFLSGASFLKISKEGRRILTKYVEAFRERKEILAKSGEQEQQL